MPLEQLEDRVVPTVVFEPAVGPDSIFWRSTDGGQPAGTVITAPIPQGGNPDVLNSETVYLIFWGTGWTTQRANAMASAAETICNSDFFSQLSDYGSDGKVTYSGFYTIDSSSNPTASSSITTEIQKELQNEAFPLPGGGSVLNSPIYAVVESFGGAGFNDPKGTYTPPNSSTSLPFNEVLIGANSYDDVDGFSDLFSHEVAERMSDGTGNGIGMNAPNAHTDNEYQNAQISDNEPDNGNYTARINGSVLVQAYWSIKDGGFVIPDPAGAPTVQLNPVWNGLGTNSPSFTGTYNMTVDGHDNETITIQSSPDNANYIEVWQSSISTTEPVFTGLWSTLIGRTILIHAGSNDKVDVRNLPANVTLEIESDYADTINVSPGTDQTTILGTIDVLNGGATTATLNINDSADSKAVGRTVTFGAGPNGLDQITTSGLGTIYYDYGTQFKPEITVTGSQFGNTYDVERADVQSLTIHSNGSDSVTVGNSTDGVQEITGDVILTNGSAATNLTVDDSADPTNTPYTVGFGWNPAPFSDNLSYGTVDGLLPGGFSVFFQDSSLASLTVKTPAVDNTVNVYRTFAPTYLISGGSSPVNRGYDTVNVGAGGSVSGIGGDLYIENRPALDTVNVDDSLDPTTGRQVTLSDYTPPSPAPPPFDDTDTFGRISGLTASGATINYEYLDTSSVTIQTGPADIVNVFSTGVTTNLVGTREPNLGTDPTTVIVGNGGSLAGINGTLNIENPPFSNDITVDDSADSSAPTFTVSTLGINPADSQTNAEQWGQITGLPTGASINYEYSDTPSLTLKTGPGATVDVLATFNTLNLVGNGQTTVNLGDQNNVQGLYGSLFVQNQVAAQTNVYLNDSSDTTSLPNVALNDYFDATGALYMSISNLALGATIYTQNSGVAAVTITGGTPLSGGNTYNITNTTFNTSVTLAAGAGGGDIVNLFGSAGPVIVDPNGSLETVNVGLDGYVGLVDGGITIKPGLATLTVDDSADPKSRTLNITSQGLDNGLAPGAYLSPWLTYSSLDALNILGGTPPPVNGLMATGDTFNVLSTPNTFGGFMLQTGGARNIVNVQSSANLLNAELNIQGTGGNDTVTLGSLAPGMGGNMASIPNVDVTNPGGSTSLILDDSGDRAPRTPTVTSFSVTNLGTNPGAPLFGLPTNTQFIQYAAGQVTSLVIYAGSGGNTFTVQGTGAGTSTTINGGSGGDTANVYANSSALTVQGFANVNLGQNGLVSNISGDITANNDAAVSVDDSKDSSAQTLTITASTVNGFPSSSGSSWLTYSGLKSLTIHAGTPSVGGVPTGAGNTFYVQGTASMPAGTASMPGGTILYGGLGPDTFDVGSAAGMANPMQSTLDPIQGVLSVYGSNPEAALNVYDSNTSSPESYAVSSTQVTRTPYTPGQPEGSPTQTINYFSLGSVNVYGGSAADVFGVLGTLQGTSVAVYGGSSSTTGIGSNEFIVENTADTLNDIHGPVALHGGGLDEASLVDGLNTVGHTYVLRSADVQRDDLADITYDGMGFIELATGDNPYSGHTPPSTVKVLSTAPNVSTDVAVGVGDTVDLGMPTGSGSTLESFQGPLAVVAGEYSRASATVVVDDSADPNSRQAIYQNTGSGTYKLGGLAGPATNPQPIYLYLAPTANVSVLGGSGNNVFQIEGGIVPGSITAGSGNDTFQIFTGAGITGTLDGGGGSNTLDYSQYVGDVLVDLLAASATATGGIAHIQTVSGSQGNNLLVGNANPSKLVGGTGRNVLIGGAGQATLDANTHSTGDNILIGGRTDWDMNLAALQAIMAEWDRPDLSFTDRRSDLLNGTNSLGKTPLNTIIVNGQKQLVLLTPSTNPTSSNGTVHANAFMDTLTGGTANDPATGKRLHNWFLYALSDVINNYVKSSDKKDHIT
jgi:hypothetical protein